MDAQEKEEMKTRDREDGHEIEELKKKEIKGALKKNKKAMDIDGILMEAWKYVKDTLWKDMVELLGQVWRQGEIPED